MKNLSLWSITLIVLTFASSCNSDSTVYEDPAAVSDSTDSDNYLMRGSDVSNPENSYDAVGALYADITEEYLDSDPEITSIANTIIAIENMANLDSRFLALKPHDYLSPAAARIEELARNEAISLDDLPISAHAKTNLGRFIDSLMVHQEADTNFDSIYDYIVDFEASVINDILYTATDRKVLLCTGSLARHAFDVQRKRRKDRDRDWDLSWGSIYAGSEGASENEAQGVIMSVVTTIVLNNN